MAIIKENRAAEMSATNEVQSQILAILTANEDVLLTQWVKEQLALVGGQQGNIKENDLAKQCKEFLNLLKSALKQGNFAISSDAWQPVRLLLADISRSRSELGFTPSETALFVFSFKRPFFGQLQDAMKKDAPQLVEAIISSTTILDALGLYTTEMYQKSREQVILRQQQEMMELSTPVVSLADGILALPLIGTLDSARTQVVMESLLQSIVETGSTVAIIDITGVPMVDTLVAQHLLKTVTAARLMGADCIISGIRPQIAQTIVHLGVELGDVVTKASLAAAFRTALDRRGMTITRITSAGTKVLEKA